MASSSLSESEDEVDVKGSLRYVEDGMLAAKSPGMVCFVVEEEP